MLTGTTSTHQIPGCNLTLYSGPLAGWEETGRFSRQGGVDGFLWDSSVVTVFVAGWKEGKKEGLASSWRGTEARG